MIYDGPYYYGISHLVSRYLIYGLTDPDSGAVRYIGRSMFGFVRVQEHALRIGRERTHKANWIRSLLRAGKMYGVRILEECVGPVETIEAEVRWIAEARRLGWDLTNHTDGGEGAAAKKIQLPDAEIGRRYLAGESEKRLAEVFGVNRNTIERRLREMGIERRGGSASMRLRHKRSTPEERLRLARFAHAGRKAACARRKRELDTRSRS